MAVATAEQARQVLDRAQRDPVWWVREVLGGFLWSKQREVLESLRDNRRTAVRSGHGVGKTHTAADAVLWFLYSFPEARVITTATTFSQVRDLLWREINNLHGKALFPLGGQVLQTRIELEDGRFAVGLSAKPENKESFQGHHAQHILLVFDEASGVPEPIFEAGEGYMTTAGAKQLLIGNPTRTQGTFFDAFNSRLDEYHQIAISALDAPAFIGEEVPDDVASRLVSEEWVAERRKWEGTPLWDIRVLGEFPEEDDNTVFPMSLLRTAQALELPGTDKGQYGCDIARMGEDQTAIYRNRGGVIRVVKVVGKQDTMATTGLIAKLLKVRGDVPAQIDAVGVGAGVFDRLREQNLPVFEFNAGAAPLDRERFINRRAEVFWSLRERMEDEEIDLPPEGEDDDLIAQLGSLRWFLDSRGRIGIESKDDMRKRGLPSPDRADAVAMAAIPPPVIALTSDTSPPAPAAALRKEEW
jgi:phage terminase large subunit